MRRNLKNVCLWAVPVAMLAGCGGVEGEQQESAELGQSEQGVLYAPVNYSLTLTEQPISSALASELATLDAEHTWNRASLRRFDYVWSYAGEPSLAKAVEAVQGERDYAEFFEYGESQDLTYAQFFNEMGSDFEPLHPDILATYSNGIENVQVRHYYFDMPVAPGASGWFNLFVIHFPQSHKVLVYTMSVYET